MGNICDLSPKYDEHELAENADAPDDAEIEDDFMRGSLLDASGQCPTSVSRTNQWTDPNDTRPGTKISSMISTKIMVIIFYSTVFAAVLNINRRQLNWTSLKYLTTRVLIETLELFCRP